MNRQQDYGKILQEHMQQIEEVSKKLSTLPDTVDDEELVNKLENLLIRYVSLRKTHNE